MHTEAIFLAFDKIKANTDVTKSMLIRTYANRNLFCTLITLSDHLGELYKELT